LKAMRRRAVGGLAASIALLAMGGCAQLPHASVKSPDAVAPTAWSGRLSLRVDSVPVQTFAALFDLSGTPTAGDLTLTTPIGSTLAMMHWAPGDAVLKNGATTRHFDSIDTLIEAATGTAIPVGALFGWLAGRDDNVAGWHANLSQVGAGRLQATRTTPLPTADLRIAFERQ